MISRRKEPEGKPFMRVPLDRPPVKKPARKKPAENRPAGDPMKAIDRANRSQAMEANEMRMTKKPMAKGGKVMKHASKAGNAMKKKSADTMGRAMKKYAKGGSVDGCATKGKTKTKMVKMAMGGMVGTGKMPASGGKAGMAPAGRAAMMARQGNNRGAAMLPGRRTFKGGGSCGMKKGK